MVDATLDNENEYMHKFPKKERGGRKNLSFHIKCTGPPKGLIHLIPSSTWRLFSSKERRKKSVVVKLLSMLDEVGETASGAGRA